MKLTFHTLDVFTDRPFSGNPLAVAREADELTTEQMQAVAREFNLSETVFFQEPENPAHTARAGPDLLLKGNDAIVIAVGSPDLHSGRRNPVRGPSDHCAGRRHRGRPGHRLCGGDVRGRHRDGPSQHHLAHARGDRRSAPQRPDRGQCGLRHRRPHHDSSV